MHFITCCCYRRRALLAMASRRDLFLQMLEEVRRRYGFVVVGYVVMPEHFHLLISEPEKGDPGKVMQVLTQRVARRLLQRRRKAPGQEMLFDMGLGEEHFWQKRFHDFNVWTARKRRGKLRYMHLNPVKRGLVSAPESWKWSSFRAYALGESGVVKLNQWPAKLKMMGPGGISTHPSKTAKGGAPTLW